MIRASLVVSSFISSAYTGVSLFGVANGLILAVLVACVVAYAAEGLWPPRRPNPVKIEPRLSPSASPRFGIPTRPVPPLLLAPPMEGGAAPEESPWDSVIRFAGPFDPAAWDEARNSSDNRISVSPIFESLSNPAGEILRDLARRVTPELLALPIPTAVRELLNDLKAAGE